MSEKQFKKLLSFHLRKIEKTIKELEEGRTKLKMTIEKTKEVKNSLALLDEEIRYLEGIKTKNENKFNELITNWQTSYKALVEPFELKPYKVVLTNKEGIKNFIAHLKKILKEVEREFLKNIKESFRSAGIRLPKKIDVKKVSNIDNLLERKSQQLSIKKEKFEKIKDWISSNSNEIETIESKIITMVYSKIAVSILKILLQKIQEHTNLDIMAEQVAQDIEENVRKCVTMTLPEEMIEFKHIGQGKFIIQTSTGEPITHPAGSHKAVISLGIMLTLSKIFDLPVLLDEATERFDYISLKNVFQYISMMCSTPLSPQICLVSYRTYNIEKNQEIIDIVKDWNIYLLERKGKFNKEIIKVTDISQFLG